MEMSFFEDKHYEVSQKRLIAVTLTPKKKLVHDIAKLAEKYKFTGITSIGAGNALLEMLLSEFVPVSCLDFYCPWDLPEEKICIQEGVFKDANVKGKGLNCDEVLVHTTDGTVTVVKKTKRAQDAYQSLEVVPGHALLFCFGAISDNNLFIYYLDHHKYHCVIIIGDETCMPSIVEGSEFGKITREALEKCSYSVSETKLISEDCSVNFGLINGHLTTDSTNPVSLWICTRK